MTFIFKLFKAISDSLDHCKIINCILLSIIPNHISSGNLLNQQGHIICTKKTNKQKQSAVQRFILCVTIMCNNLHMQSVQKENGLSLK